MIVSPMASYNIANAAEAESAKSSVSKVRRPDVPVFMISAYGDAATVTKSLARGADGVFTKPGDLPKLKQDIMAVMIDATGGNG